MSQTDRCRIRSHPSYLRLAIGWREITCQNSRVGSTFHSKIFFPLSPNCLLWSPELNIQVLRTEYKKSAKFLGLKDTADCSVHHAVYPSCRLKYSSRWWSSLSVREVDHRYRSSSIEEIVIRIAGIVWWAWGCLFWATNLIWDVSSTEANSNTFKLVRIRQGISEHGRMITRLCSRRMSHFRETSLKGSDNLGCGRERLRLIVSGQAKIS